MFIFFLCFYYSLPSFSLHLRACCHFSRVQLYVALWTVAHQAPQSMGFSRQEYWSGLPCPPPGDLTDPGIKPMSLMSSALAAGGFYLFYFILFYFTMGATCEAPSLSLKVKLKVSQSCPTLVHGILQGRILEWVTFPVTRGSSRLRDPTQASCIAGGFFTS